MDSQRMDSQRMDSQRMESQRIESSDTDAQRWELVAHLFHSALERSADERVAWLVAQCGSDGALLAELTSLLDADAAPTPILDRGVAAVARDVIAHRNGDPLAPAQIGSYRLVSVLGEGGMGVVYLGERADLGSRAAIKILRDAWLSPARRERFTSEQRTLAQLNHPSIAPLYDSGTLPDGTPWFVMEYVEGVPITTYCTMHALSIPARLRLFRSVCEAVQHAHGHLIVHRDLKPSNIFVRSDGAVKLLDFGISKHLESGGTAADQTRTGLRMMTPAYAAPEQLRGDRIGLHTDVYSLGVVLYELLVGRPPFDLANRSAGEAERIILAGAPERPSVAARRASRETAAPRRAWADLDVLCLTAMNSDPERRYRTVDALIRDVDHFLDQEPLEARGDNARYRVGKFMTRHWRPLSVGGAVIAAVALLVVFYTLRLRAARNVALAETARVQRIQRFTVDLLEGGDENAGPSDSLRVVTLVDRGVREVRGLNEEPVVQAQLYATLGDISLKLGQLPRADSLFHAALDVQRKTSGADNADVAQTLVGLGMLRSAQAQFGPAEQLVRSGLAMSRRHLPANHPVVLKAATSLGQVIENRGDYKGAITVLDSAVQLQAGSHGVTPELIAMLTELANSEFYAGDYRKSDSLNRVVLAMNRRLYGDRHPLVADILINLGAIQLEWQNYAAAERYYREAIPIVRAWYGENHPETASDLTMLGRVLVSEKRYGEASALLHQALAIQEHVYGPVHPRVASALNELGRVAQQEGHLDEAQADFERMVSIYRTVYADKHYLIGVALSNLAGVYHDRRNYAQAERLFHDAIRRYQVELPADHQLMGIARVRLGETLVADRKFADAEHELRAGGAILEKQTPPPPLWVERGRNALATAYDSLREPALADSIRSHFLHGSRAVAVASH